MRKKLLVLILGALLALLSLGNALAAPITCPAGQTVVKDSTGWHCQNNGGSGNPNTERHKGNG